MVILVCLSQHDHKRAQSIVCYICAFHSNKIIVPMTAHFTARKSHVIKILLLIAFHFLLGTRIIYDRKFLLQMRNSPLTKTPPAKLAAIPDIINEDTCGSPPLKTKSPEPVVTGEGREGKRDTCWSTIVCET